MEERLQTTNKGIQLVVRLRVGIVIDAAETEEQCYARTDLG